MSRASETPISPRGSSHDMVQSKKPGFHAGPGLKTEGFGSRRKFVGHEELNRREQRQRRGNFSVFSVYFVLLTSKIVEFLTKSQGNGNTKLLICQALSLMERIQRRGAGTAESEVPVPLL